MALADSLRAIASLKDRGIIGRYATTRAVAAVLHSAAVMTRDVDVLLEVAAFDRFAGSLLLTTRLDAALAALGYSERDREGIIVEGWPVRFIPVASDLDEAALDDSISVEVAPGVAVQALTPEHLVVKALLIGRTKDFERIDRLLDGCVVDPDRLRELIVRFGLARAWSDYCTVSGRPDMLAP
jgi:hypothetical protein